MGVNSRLSSACVGDRLGGTPTYAGVGRLRRALRGTCRATGISLESASGKGWDHNLTLDQLKNRLEKTEDKSQAAIVLEKNFTGDNKEDEAVAELLMQIGFETIVVRSCHSSATVIDKINKNSK